MSYLIGLLIVIFLILLVRSFSKEIIIMFFMVWFLAWLFGGFGLFFWLNNNNPNFSLIAGVMPCVLIICVGIVKKLNDFFLFYLGSFIIMLLHINHYISL